MLGWSRTTSVLLQRRGPPRAFSAGLSPSGVSRATGKAVSAHDHATRVCASCLAFRVTLAAQGGAISESAALILRANSGANLDG